MRSSVVGLLETCLIAFSTAFSTAFSVADEGLPVQATA